ncbi:GNAT family acetyltransferase [Pilimelia terevasa]|uniref:GNAT family acetyltransferase n=1 Tax=Pilimelia terevasa TaxID=53372 RepID=A0A8J3BD27_9ACTN|nr:GNAT family N-acetyltransferase [Pilimelia terevasa]GGK12767.1 GNAT family acetyltransferase [Pilimelia terevasa]
MELATARLRLRRLTDGDVEDLRLLDGDPEVRRFLGGAPPTRAQVAEATLPRMRAYDGTGFGYWAAEAAGRFAGWFALRPEPARPGELELGYRLARAAWGRGYATEGGRALLAHAFADPATSAVYAETMAVNARSRAVLARLGFRHTRTFHPHFDAPLPGSEHGEVEYVLTRSRWAALPADRP